MRTNTQKIKTGLALIGLAWAPALADAQVPAVTPPALPQAPSNAPAFAVLLLSNGQIRQGLVSEDKAGENYLLHGKVGTIPFPKGRVERRFASFADLYAYKVASLAPGDPDERMKLAKWCLSFQMPAEAKRHLEELLAINPDDALARQMIANLKASEERGETGRDPAVLTTGAEVVDTPPRELNPKVLPRARGEVGRALATPVIFDLPPAEASKKAILFRNYVHPVLQSSCASCHNDNYQGDFRLISGNSKREWNAPEIVRSNLDAALRLVNRDDPSRSDLLTFGTSPHGPNTRAIFSGPNDRGYRTLQLWLTGLKAPEPPRGAPYPAPGYGPQPAPVGSARLEQFGADRINGRPGPGMPPPSPGPAAPPLPDNIPRKPSEVDIYEAYAAPVGAEGAQFPLPFPVGGTLPKPPARPADPKAPQPKAAGGIVLPTRPDGTPMPPPDDVIPPTARAKKDKTIKPELLEGVLKNRQSGQP